jgi:two-component system chemotaxis response regulator CheY
MKSDRYIDFRKLKVLVIEDSSFMARLLKTMLRGLMLNDVTECLDPSKALDYVRDIRPDMIFIDRAMPYVDGLEVTRRIRASQDLPNPYLPIIMLSSFARRTDVAAARDAGVTEFLAKPISSGAVYGHLARCIEEPRPFVKAKTFIGPDRRRRRETGHEGAERRRNRKS